MDIHGYSAHILVNGRKVKEYRHKGLTFIEAKDGTEFTVEVKNHTGQRILAIVSVDGLDIIDGKSATSKSRGYIINPHSADTFSGWRRSKEQVASFKFTTKEKSYATEKGEGQNNGVIAIRLIAEKLKPFIPQFVAPAPEPYQWPSQPRTPFLPPSFGDHVISGTSAPTLGGGTTTSNRPRTRVTYSANGLFAGPATRGVQPAQAETFNYSVQSTSLNEESVAVAGASFDMGTGWGTAKEEKVVETEFEYGVELGTLEFFYASRDALKAMGIPLVTQREVPALPRGFKDAPYAQPPKDWRG